MEFDVRTPARESLVDVTDRVSRAVAESGASEGVAVVFVRHTTAGLTINEDADPSVVEDLLEGLRRLVPRVGDWQHREGNSDAHIKASLVGSSVLVPVAGARLQLGTWQGIYLCEFDGPRTRRVAVTTLPMLP